MVSDATHDDDRFATETEYTAVAHECLIAALAIVRGEFSPLTAMDESVVTGVTLRAIQAARAVIDQRPRDAPIVVAVDLAHIAATAVWMVWNRIENDEIESLPISPFSSAGEVLLGFAGAMRILEAVTQVQALSHPADLWRRWPPSNKARIGMSESTRARGR